MKARSTVAGILALTLSVTSAHAEDTVPRHDGRFTSGTVLVTIGSVLLVATAVSVIMVATAERGDIGGTDGMFLLGANTLLASLGTGIPGIVLLATSKTPTWSDTNKTAFAPPHALSIPIFSTSF
jgi:hypothetical protein